VNGPVLAAESVCHFSDCEKTEGIESRCAAACRVERLDVLAPRRGYKYSLPSRRARIDGAGFLAPSIRPQSHAQHASIGRECAADFLITLVYEARASDHSEHVYGPWISRHPPLGNVQPLAHSSALLREGPRIYLHLDALERAGCLCGTIAIPSARRGGAIDVRGCVDAERIPLAPSQVVCVAPHTVRFGRDLGDHVGP